MMLRCPSKQTHLHPICAATYPPFPSRKDWSVSIAPLFRDMLDTGLAELEHYLQVCADWLRQLAVGSTRRTDGCGPACPVVWQGAMGNRAPYADLRKVSLRPLKSTWHLQPNSVAVY
jgi:hypothetical protein